HHHYQSTANQGFFWWEVDPSYYLLKGMAWLGLASHLRRPPKSVLKKNLLTAGQTDRGMERVAELAVLVRRSPEHPVR
ncbi:MAG: hypothetical protein ACE5HN_03440, partial [Nitrospiria bacterium]